MKTSLFLFPSALSLFLSCAAQKPVCDITGEWNVTSINGQSVEEGEYAPTIGFSPSDNLVYGFTGCNRLTGSFDAKSFLRGKADFSQLGMTRMLCEDARYERPLVDALGKATKSEISEKEIKIKDRDGSILLILTKKQNNANCR